MKRTIDVPPDMVPVWMDGGGVLVLPVSIYVAALKLGKQLRRRERLAQRTRESLPEMPKPSQAI